MKDLQKIKEFFSKPLEEVKKDEYGNHLEPQFKKGDKVTYLGHPAEITAVNKEMGGTYSYSVEYDKGQGKTKASNLKNKGGEIKLTEVSNTFNLETAVSDLMKAYHTDKEKALKILNKVPQIEKIINLGYAKTAPEALGILKGGGARTFDYLLNIDEINEEYTVAGRPVTLNKGKKSNGTDWTVTFLSDSSIGKKGEEIPLSDVLALIKPFPKGITMNEAKKETGVDMAKKQLDALGVKYEMSKTDKVRPFKVIYKPVNKSDEFYDKFEDIVDLFNLKGFVKTSMNEAKKEDAVDTITMDIPLFLRMLEYSREDAKKDLDLHDVTEKANKLGKERGILSMDDYEEIVGVAEEIDEANVTWSTLHRDNANEKLLKQSKLSSAEYQKAKKLQGFKADNYKWNADEDLYIKVNEGELTEANVPSNIRDFAKRKGISSLVNKVAGWAEKVGARIAGGTAVGKNYSTLVLDLDYKQQGEIRIDTDEETVTLYDEPVYDFKSFQRVYVDGQDGNLEEGAEEQLSFISKARAKSSLRQFLSGKRDDGMGKFDAIVYGIDADGNKHQIKSYNDLQNYEEFALSDNPDFVKEGLRGELDEPFFIEVSVRDARKALDLFQDRYRNSNIDMYGSNVYAADTPEDIYDLYYDLMSQDIEVLDYNVEDEDFDYDSEYEKTLRETIKFIKESTPEATTEEVIAELKEIKALGEQLNEELCPAGKAYIKRRQAAGEKSSAYLSGRGVKVCKGQMSGRKKKK